ncbi:hypothetical protein C8R47DRAFT_1323414 [Mycena vitilis]|nr:hypothetical protein C8R47DRAFT_1323414 [Mycena vitilis]
MPILRPQSFIERENHFLCLLCPNAKWMYESEACRHEISADHTARVRVLSGASPPSSPFHVSSPPEQNSSRPASPSVSDSAGTLPPFLSNPGPCLPGDDEDAIYDDWDDTWGPGMPQPDLDLDEGWADDKRPDLDCGDAAATAPPDDDEQDTAPPDDDFNDATPVAVAETEGEVFSGIGNPEESTTFGTAQQEEDYSDNLADNANWWPWATREEALLDIMTAFPRSVFSESELNATRWFASKCGVSNLPPIRQVKQHRSKILDLCGANLTAIDGRLGNTFAVLDLGKILADEFANPLVRPFIRVLSEDAGESLREASQAEKWRTDVSPNLSGPMVRRGEQDFFVNEPALAHIGPEDGAEWAAVLPSRWFMRDNQIWAKIQRLRSHPDPKKDCLLVDSRSGECEELPLARFFASFVELEAIHEYHQLKNPSKITGYATGGQDWTVANLKITPCDIQAPNPLRIAAAGRRVLPVPVWFYCDDTSGNISKKWNKHNSLLMSLAGLDPKKAHLLYNVIFLATSNLAHPLEMFDAVVEFLQ